MSLWKLVRLDFHNNPVHFGELGIGMEETAERIYSDTLFSAWFSAYARLYNDDIQELFDRFPRADTATNIAPPFRVSSTFVYSKNKRDRDIYYLPTIFKFPTGYPHGNLKFAKDFKKIKHIPVEVWKRWYQQDGMSQTDIDEITNKNGKLEALGAFDYKKIFQRQTLPKVAIDRLHAATNFYQSSFIYFRDGGLYFLFYMPQINDKLFSRLQTSLNFLGDEGIGGERSSGAGRFTAEWLELTAAWQSIVNPQIDRPFHALISLFWDDVETCLACIQDENTRYQIQERGGWISARSGRQLRRKSVRMFTEGSILSQPPSGRLAVVTPEELKNKQHHPIYRSGVSLSIPIKP